MVLQIHCPSGIIIGRQCEAHGHSRQSTVSGRFRLAQCDYGEECKLMNLTPPRLSKYPSLLDTMAINDSEFVPKPSIENTYCAAELSVQCFRSPIFESPRANLMGFLQNAHQPFCSIFSKAVMGFHNNRGIPQFLNSIEGDNIVFSALAVEQ